MIRGIVLVLAFLVSTPVWAEDYTYAPEGCEFRMVFPEAPSTAKACNPKNDKDCYLSARFTKVYALDSVMKINTTCNAAEKGMLERYSGDVMTFTLESMSKDKVDTPETAFNDRGDSKQAIVLGGKKMPDGTETVYMAQLWIGKKSVFTVEGEVSGASNTEADALFTTIMQSIHPESMAQPTEKPQEKEEKPAE